MGSDVGKIGVWLYVMNADATVGEVTCRQFAPRLVPVYYRRLVKGLILLWMLMPDWFNMENIFYTSLSVPSHSLDGAVSGEPAPPTKHRTTEAETSEATGYMFQDGVGLKSESLTGGGPPESESTDDLHALFRPPPPPRGARWEHTCDGRWAKIREAAFSKTSPGDVAEWGWRAKRGGSKLLLTQDPLASSALVPAALHLLLCLKWDDL